MLLVDTSFVLQILASGNAHMGEDTMIMSVFEYISNANVDTREEVVVFIDGVVAADVLETRRRQAFSRFAQNGVLTRRQDWNVNAALPGCAFIERLKQKVVAAGWHAVIDGCCVSAIARFLRSKKASLNIYKVLARERDARTIVALCADTKHVHRLTCVKDFVREYTIDYVDPHDENILSDSVVLDILCHGQCGGVVDHEYYTSAMTQDLPGLPRMPDTLAANALRQAYAAWCSQSQGRRITRHYEMDNVQGCSVDRVALGEVLTCYIDIDGGENDNRSYQEVWSTQGWRLRHSKHHFPHGFHKVCCEYLDAIDRELLQMGGYESHHDCSVYVHAYAPSAHDLANYISSIDLNVGHVLILKKERLLDTPVELWSPLMQLTAILPLSDQDNDLAKDVKTDLTLGCVHMYPSVYEVWWGKYALLPPLDFLTFEQAYVNALTKQAAMH